jgi:hemoglobin/transferrin/lactoferrin receptor protein
MQSMGYGSWYVGVALGLVLFAPWARATTPDDSIEEILVVGARLPQPAADVAATVDVISRDELLQSLVVRTSDVVRYVPGVSLSQGGTRFGDSDFTIRGLSGNRVLQLVDGIPVADQFDVGDFSDATQDYLVPDAIERIEILRGPASSLFGSDALGGVVAVVTRDPDDFLEGQSMRVAGSSTYSGADDSRIVNGAIAASGDRLAGVLHLSRLDGHELDHAASGPTDHLDRRREAFMTKVTYDLGGGQQLRLRADGFDEHVDSQLRTVLGYGRRYVTTTSLEGDDERRRWSAGIGYDFTADLTLVDAGRVDVYTSSTRVEQLTDEVRATATPALAIEREFDYEQDIVGVIADMERRFAVGATSHRIGWGASYDRRTVNEYRNGYQIDLTTGAGTSTLLGETMPVRDFPDSTIAEFGVYVLDEITYGRWALIPGARFDDYRLDAREDSLYRADNPTSTAVDVDETSVSPKLGMLYRVTDQTTLFAQYAHGFRAPPFEDVNIGLDIPRFNIRAIPNPELDPETSDGLEFGVRVNTARVAFSASLFGVDYEDFIESKVNLGADPDSGVILFQSQNIAKAQVYGAEFKVDVDLDDWLAGVSAGVAGNWTRGENQTNDEPLNSVDPPELVLQLAWTPRDSLRFALMSNLVDGQQRIDEGTANLFAPDSYVTFDLLATVRPANNVRIDMGVFNALDETYWSWATVRNRPADDPMIDALSAPGRYGSVSIQVAL